MNAPQSFPLRASGTATEVAQIDALIHELTAQRNLLVEVGRENRISNRWIAVREELAVQRAATLIAAYRLWENEGLWSAYEDACQDASLPSVAL